ncbi:MAG TPA: serine O-acetyltransferase EpsC [Candidatus Binatia bacterium]|jgi:serine O-acetyltransferase|nr:serine O-acetyltransferase EpsC [Candidatus Binatia bacterium]
MTTQRLGDLEDVIGQVAASYGAGRLIDSLGTANLPNKRQVIEALNHLKAVTYLGYYTTGDLDEGKLRFAISSHIYPAYEILVEQIRRAVDYEGFRSTTGARDADWPVTAAVGLMRTLPELRSMLSKDVLAAFQGDPAANSVEEVIFSYPSIEAITVHRIAHELHRQGVPMLPRIMAEHAHSITGIDIHPGAEIGESFFIDHGTGVVIGETSTIGNNVKIYQGVTLGAMSLERGPAADRGTKRHPTLEDHVTIYAGATILGGQTTIGAHSTIGGNVWLVESVPPGSRITFETHGVRPKV